MRSWLVPLVSAVAMVACSAEQPPIGPGGARLEVLFAPGRVELVRATPLAVSPTELGEPSQIGSDVRWELVSTAGSVVASGSAPDRRAVDYEPDDADDPDDPTMTGALRAQSATLSLELPNVAGTLRVLEPTGALIGTLEIAQLRGDYSADGWAAGKSDIDFDTDLIGDPVLLVGDGTVERHFNLLFVPEGYRADQQIQFHDDLDDLIGKLKTTDVYKDYFATHFNVWRQDIQSADTGVSDPNGVANKDTAFNITFGDGMTLPRRCLMPAANWNTVSVASLARLREMVHADVIIIIANTSEHAGCARRADRLIVQAATSARAAAVLGHELGHALFGLADEYVETGRPCQTGPNLTYSLTAIPWQDLIAPTTPIPTPSNPPSGLVGAWQGGGRCSQGVWRPEHICKMRRNEAQFCDVCERLAKQRFASLSAGTTCTPIALSAVTASADDGNGPANVIDRDLSTRWASNGSGQWIQLELAAPHLVDGVELDWYLGDMRSSNYQVETSLDGTSYSVLSVGSSSGSATASERVAVTPTLARFVRITVNGNSQNSWASINELRACGTPQ
ncbi:MAG: M64 family metallopeptidase [Kofleriaceae bacterium]